MPAEPADRAMLFMAGEWKKDVVATRGMMGRAGIALALASWFMGRMKMASTDARQAYD